jgi:hypothetical protein
MLFTCTLTGPGLAVKRIVAPYKGFVGAYGSALGYKLHMKIYPLRGACKGFCNLFNLSLFFFLDPGPYRTYFAMPPPLFLRLKQTIFVTHDVILYTDNWPAVL